MLNQNDDKPVQVVARWFRDNIQSFSEMVFESQRQQDSIAAWLVGMSTGAIALIISQFGKFNSTLYFFLQGCVLFLASTIVLGMLFRIFHLFFQDSERLEIIEAFTWLSGYIENYREVPIELPEDSSAGFIAWCLYNHMGIYMEPDLLREIEAKNDVEYWRNQYQKHTALHFRLEGLKYQAVKPMLAKFSKFRADLKGVDPQKYEQKVSKDKSKGTKKRYLMYACKFFYTTMCMSFAIAVLFISYGFIRTDLKENPPSGATNQKVSSPVQQVQPTQTDKSD